MQPEPLFIGLAGGSGVGKSAVAFAIQDKYPEDVTVLHLDDYFKPQKLIPLLAGRTNWDHPSAIDFDQLLRDVKTLRAGQPATVMTKSERLNPEYKTSGKKPVDVPARPIILLEGYLTLWHPEVRNHLYASVYFEAPAEVRMKRRTKFLDDEYQQHVLQPMYRLFVEPTKKFADFLVDVGQNELDAVVPKVLQVLSIETLLLEVQLREW